MYRLPEFLQSALESATTIVTAQPRQAFAIRTAWGEHQRRLGRRVWSTPDVLPLSAWLARDWSQALASETGSSLPTLLSPAQERTIWEQVVQASARHHDFLHPHGAARAALRTWQRLHEWAIDVRTLEPAASEETRAFLAWAASVSHHLREHDWIDSARALWRGPTSVPGNGYHAFMLLGFDVESPAQRALLSRLSAHGVQVRDASIRRAQGLGAKLGLADVDAEVRAAAGWARRWLERDPEARLLIAIPDLEQRRGAVEHILADVLDPVSLLVASPARAASFALEDSVALDRYPIVATALAALELTAQRLSFDTVSHWLRSPYLLSGTSCAASRARLDAILRGIAPEQLDLSSLNAALASIRLQHEEDGLTGSLRRFGEELRRPALAPGEWSAVFASGLTSLGWPGDRPLDSAEFQTVEKFHAALSELATLDRILGRVELAAAVRSLRRLLEQIPFQPETGDTPVTVTSRIGDPVLIYDGIWVSGLHADAWPEAPRPDPFIPWSMQVAAGIPEASASGLLERARRTLANWIASSCDVIMSWPLRLDDEPCDPSPLIAPLPDAPPALAAATTRRFSEIIFESARLERLVDEAAPPLSRSARSRGGARALTLQSLCPFRAFAEQRLGAERIEQPEPGIDARTRGSFIHRALERVWSSLESQDELCRRSPEERNQVIDAAVRAARREVLERRRSWSTATLAIETQRLQGLLRTWLEMEAARASFRVLALEHETDCLIGDLAFNVRIDRIDQLADGRQLLIDYKTGQASANHWFGERPEDPQMPLYAHALASPPAALAYGVLNAQGCRFEGVSASPVAVEGLETAPDWPTQIARWRSVIERLAAEFSAGRAAVDPQPTACARCHLHSLCRIDELGTLSAREDGDE